MVTYALELLSVHGSRGWYVVTPNFHVGAANFKLVVAACPVAEPGKRTNDNICKSFVAFRHFGSSLRVAFRQSSPRR